ncbi:thiamine diphosphokinase [bacterium]|nr:thiamine diphosphokinase [bacterium]
MNEHVVIITGASLLSPSIVAAIPATSIVLGVDSGLDAALSAGLRPSGLIGDLDSVSDDGLAWAEAHATIARHPADKTQTDTELALAFAAGMRPERLTMIGGGDRLDHTIAAIGALAARHLTGVPILDCWWNGQHLDVIHGPGRRELLLEPTSTLSLLAIGPKCNGVGISGVRWPLDKHRLEPVVGHGVSNEVTDADGVVPITVSSGVLTIFNVPQTDPPIERN